MSAMSDLTAHLVYAGIIVLAFFALYRHASRKANKIVSAQNPIVKAKTCIKTLRAGSDAADRIVEASRKMDSSVVDLPPIVAEAIAEDRISEHHARKVIERIAAS